MVMMNTGVTMALALLLAMSLLFAVFGLIFSRIRKKLQKSIAENFKKEEILGATTRANFFGIKSKGGKQIRGNGALVLTRKQLYFIRAVPRQEYNIPIGSVREVSLPRSFNGKSALVRLLCVHYGTEYGEDAIAWAIRKPRQWKEAIETLLKQ